MIFNALKWRAKPERRESKPKTTINIDQRITRMSKDQPMISSRMIRDRLELPVSTVTVRRRLCEANLFSRINVFEHPPFQLIAQLHRIVHHEC